MLELLSISLSLYRHLVVQVWGYLVHLPSMFSVVLNWYDDNLDCGSAGT